MLAQHLDDGAQLRQRRPEQRPPGAFGRLRLRERRRDLLLRPGADPRVPAQLVRLGGGLQGGDGRDAELLPDPPRGLRPEPRQPHEDRDLRGHLGLPLGQRVDLAVVDDLDDLLLDRLADPLQLLRLAVERELRDGGRRLADPRRRLPVGADPEPVRPLELHQVGEQVELLREQFVPREFSHVAIIGAAMRATVCLPTYNEQENLEPMLRALGDVLATGDRVLVIDDSSPDGTGELADRLAAELDFVDVLHRAEKEGLGPAYLAGFRSRAGERRRADSRDGLRLLARPARRPSPDRSRRGRRRSRARLPLRARRARPQLGASPPGDLARRPPSTRRSSCGWA